MQACCAVLQCSCMHLQELSQTVLAAQNPLLLVLQGGSHQAPAPALATSPARAELPASRAKRRLQMPAVEFRHSADLDRSTELQTGELSAKAALRSCLQCPTLSCCLSAGPVLPLRKATLRKLGNSFPATDYSLYQTSPNSMQRHGSRTTPASPC